MLFRSLADTVNKRKFQVRIPEYYDTTIPKYFKDPNGPPPIYAPNVDDMCTSYMTIAQIVDMCFNNVKFIIVGRYATKTIIENLRDYLLQVEQYKGTNPTLDIFIERGNAALRILMEENEAIVGAIRYKNNGGPTTPTDVLGLLQQLESRNLLVKTDGDKTP